MTLGEHLAELRKRIITCLIAVLIGMTICIVLRQELLEFLTQPLRDLEHLAPGEEMPLLSFDPLEPFSLTFKLAGYGGIILAMPVILWQLWRFVEPGLYAHEKKYAVPFTLSALVLFALGAGLAFWTTPRALDFFQSLFGNDVFNYEYTAEKYLTLVVYMMLAFGVGFEFPILLIFLQMAGILQPDTLIKGWRFAVIGIFVLVAVITPSADPISLFALALPMCLFYGVSIGVGRVFVRRRERREALELGPGTA
jgi:sec-independent protein translocase protein TatC